MDAYWSKVSKRRVSAASAPFKTLVVLIALVLVMSIRSLINARYYNWSSNDEATTVFHNINQEEHPINEKHWMYAIERENDVLEKKERHSNFNEVLRAGNTLKDVDPFFASVSQLLPPTSFPRSSTLMS